MNPEYAAQLASSLRQAYADAEVRILERMAAALAEGDGVPDALEHRLTIQRRMIRDIDRILRGLQRGTPSALRELVALSLNAGAAEASAAAVSAGIIDTPTAAAAPGVITAAGSPVAGLLAGEARDTARELMLIRAGLEPLEAIPVQVRRWVKDTYAKVGLKAALEKGGGDLTRQQVSLRLLQSLTRKGITGFTDRAGRSWEMGAYAEMVGRTTSMQAGRAAHEDRLQSLGVDTVFVQDHPEECKLCRPWEGKVLSISGRTAGTTLKDGRKVVASVREARRAGLNHPNCGHSLSMYLPGITTPPPRATADPEGEALREKQRAYERRVRELKRDAAIASEGDPADKARAAGKLKAKRQEFRAWREEHDRRDQSYRTNTRHR